MRRNLLACCLVLTVAIALPTVPALLPPAAPGAPPAARAQAATPIDGSLANDLCPDFILEIIGIDADIPDPGWVLVDPARRFRSVTGRVADTKPGGVNLGTRVTHTDFAFSHDSHDVNVFVEPDPGQEDVLSNVGHPNNEDPVLSLDQLQTPTLLEVEWEIGTEPDERGAGAPERTFPRWAWPSPGDRVWVNGNWIFDCGHGKPVGPLLNPVSYKRTEIHPPRAIASMRDQVRTLPGTGTTPVPVTSTDLYIHGQAGVVTDLLECSPAALIDQGTCDIAAEPHRGSPIDEDFTFDIQLPPKRSPRAVLATFVEDGPGNTLGVAPVLEPVPPDNPTSLRVTVPLAGSGAQPTDTYARKIHAGWVFPAVLPPRHFNVSLVKMDLHEDHETDPGDCECTFFWATIDQAPDEWHRLVDFQIPTDDDAGFPCFSHTNTMNDWDDDGGCGNGELRFSGPTWDFHLRPGQPFTIGTTGYDQDCFDDHFGNHDFSVGAFIDCWVGAGFELNPGDNDAYDDLIAAFRTPDYASGEVHLDNNGDEYTSIFDVRELPPGDEDSADLEVTKGCEPATVGASEPFTCTVEVRNHGPGLPRNVIFSDTVQSELDPGEYTVEQPMVEAEGMAAPPVCTAPFPEADNSGQSFDCNVETIPVGAALRVRVTVTSNQGGQFRNLARVAFASDDPEPANNQALAGPVTVDPRADLRVTKTAAPSPVLAGGRLTYTVTATNHGPSGAADVAVSDPVAAAFQSATPSAGGTCTTPAAGAAGEVACTWPGVTRRGESRSVTIVVEVGGPGTLANTATARSATEDPDPGNDGATVITEIVCTHTGTAGNDRLTGTAGADVICGLGGDDILAGLGGADRVFGGAGNDTVDAGAGNDTVHGEAGDDVIEGGAGADLVFGGDGGDTIQGGLGANRIDGGPGADTCAGAGTKTACEVVGP